MGMSEFDPRARSMRPWNAGTQVGPKRPLTQKQIWAIRFHLDREQRFRDRALFDLAIDSKLRGCDLVELKIGDLIAGAEIRHRATIIQRKASKPTEGRAELSIYSASLDRQN
ncbi:integrase [Sphingomicrobium nitratireducens]|uniref:integrase n=1 Tax=Sphingomicrobium nitratireducens TaxID=2964666 RepID=UPI003B846805